MLDRSLENQNPRYTDVHITYRKSYTMSATVADAGVCLLAARQVLFDAARCPVFDYASQHSKVI